jgi:hypothetical protein
MSLQHEHRNFPEVGTEADKSNYQRFEHSPLDLVHFKMVTGAPSLEIGTRFPVVARIYCPDVRVISRIACLFEPTNPNDRDQYNLSTLNSDIVAYRCMNSTTRIARVGEIVGKNGVPLQFPKSDIDGIAFQNEDDMPWIDVVVNLAYPGVEGTWTLFYHATSNNKLKKLEWEGYITRVTMHVQSGPNVVKFGGAG